MSSSFSITSQRLTLRVASLGAELQSLIWHDREYIYQKVAGFWQRQSPILFPIVGALEGGKYTYHGTVYSLPQHGFARDREFHLIDRGEDFLEFFLEDDDETYALFPFRFRLLVRYRVGDSGCTTTYTIMNPDREAILLASIGGHPAFQIKNSIDAYSLLFPDDTMIVYERLSGGLLDTHNSFSLSLDDHVLRLKESLFDSDALIIRSCRSQHIILCEKNQKRISFSRGDFPFFALWRQPRAPFLCLEPWLGHADTLDGSKEFIHKEGILTLLPGAEWKGSWGVEFF